MGILFVCWEEPWQTYWEAWSSPSSRSGVGVWVWDSWFLSSCNDPVWPLEPRAPFPHRQMGCPCRFSERSALLTLGTGLGPPMRAAGVPASPIQCSQNLGVWPCKSGESPSECETEGSSQVPTAPSVRCRASVLATEGSYIDFMSQFLPVHQPSWCWYPPVTGQWTFQRQLRRKGCGRLRVAAREVTVSKPCSVIRRG